MQTLVSLRVLLHHIVVLNPWIMHRRFHRGAPMPGAIDIFGSFIALGCMKREADVVELERLHVRRLPLPRPGGACQAVAPVAS